MVLPPTTAMTHIAIQEALDGKVVDWMEKVLQSQRQFGKCAKNSSTIFQVCSGCSSHGMWPHLSMNASVELLISECASQIFASPARSCRPCRRSTGAVLVLSFGRMSYFPSAFRKAGGTRKLYSLGFGCEAI